MCVCVCVCVRRIACVSMYAPSHFYCRKHTRVVVVCTCDHFGEVGVREVPHICPPQRGEACEVARRKKKAKDGVTDEELGFGRFESGENQPSNQCNLSARQIS